MRTARIKEGFGMIQRDIMTSDAISANAKALYALLVSYAGDKATCYPSINTICKNLKLSKPTIIKSINELKNNCLVVVQKKITKQGDYGNNVYEPLYLIEEVEVVKEIDYPSQLDLLGVVKDVDPKNNTLRNNIEEPSFEIFWNLYGLKKERDSSEKSWSKLTTKQKQDCIRLTPNYLNYLKKPEQSWLKQMYPSKYINQKRWLDEFETIIEIQEEQNYSLMPLN